MKKEKCTKVKAGINLCVSRKFYKETLERVDMAMGCCNANSDDRVKVRNYIRSYLETGCCPDETLQGQALLVVSLLKPEIDKAIARSAKARARRRIKSVPAVAESEVENEEITDVDSFVAKLAEMIERKLDQEEEVEQGAKAVAYPLNRRQRRRQEQAARRKAGKKRIKALGTA